MAIQMFGKFCAGEILPGCVTADYGWMIGAFTGETLGYR
jgi:hypothetical protein